MHDIIEHYGKVVVALAGVLAALLLTAAVVGLLCPAATGAIEDIEYESQIYEAMK